MQMINQINNKKNSNSPFTCVSAVPAADSPGDGGLPEEAGRVLRGPEAVPEERVRSERLLPVSLAAAPHFHTRSGTAACRKPCRF